MNLQRLNTIKLPVVQLNRSQLLPGSAPKSAIPEDVPYNSLLTGNGKPLYLHGKKYLLLYNDKYVWIDTDGVEHEDAEGTTDYKNAVEILSFPSGKTSIEQGEFAYRTNLQKVVFTDNIVSIGNGAFRNTSLASITIPNSVTGISVALFCECTSLTSVTIHNSVTSIGEASFMDCSSLASIKIPNSVTSIENCAFFGCTSLTSIPIHNSVTSIGNASFMRCTSLASIKIPNSVTSIGSYAFNNCTGLKDFYVNWEEPLDLSSTSYVFANSNRGNATLHVPSGTKSLYEADAEWGLFGNIVEN